MEGTPERLSRDEGRNPSFCGEYLFGSFLIFMGSIFANYWVYGKRYFSWAETIVLSPQGFRRTLSGAQEISPPGSEGLAFAFRSAEPFGLPSAMRPRREFGRTLGPNGAQG